MSAVSTIQDSRYSWFRLAVSLALATIGGIGIWAGIVVLPFIQVEFGVDRSGASFPYTMSMIGFALGGVLMGRLADRFGIMVPMFIGSIMLGLGFIASAFAPTYWMYVVAQAVLIGLGCATIFGPLVADVSLWFQKRRGIAVAVAASGNYIAGTIWPPVLTWGIQTYGWRKCLHCAWHPHRIAHAAAIAFPAPPGHAGRAAQPLHRRAPVVGKPPMERPSCKACSSLQPLPAAWPCPCPRFISSPIAATWVTARPAVLKCFPSCWASAW